MASTKLLIIGGGTAGIMVAAKFRKEHKMWMLPCWNQVIPITTSQPGPPWSRHFDFKKTARSMSSVMPKGVNWVKDKATGFDPRTIWCTPKRTVIYLRLPFGSCHWSGQAEPTMIEGLAEALDKGTVVSNYTNPNTPGR